MPSPFHPLSPSMKRRCSTHDYCSRSMYMVTLVIEGRRQLLGILAGDPRLPNGAHGSAHLVPSPLGEAVAEEWRLMPSWQPELHNIALQLMPDHLHLIAFVKAPLPKRRPLGTVIAVFKARCRQRYLQLITDGLAPPVPPSIATEQQAAQREGRKALKGLLFEPGFNDKILLRDGELRTWEAYLADNPRRRLLKALNPHLFSVKHDIRAGGFRFEAMGNEFLLAHPRRVFVKCSRRLTADDIAALIGRNDNLFREGAVFVSAAISPGEKAVMRHAFTQCCPVVVLRENGFAAYEKPGGAAFDACAEGRMLLLAPWQHHNARVAITREQCLMLNAMGEAISTERLA